MRNSDYKKPRMDDGAAAAASLANHGLAEIVASGNAASHVFDSPLHTRGNLRRKPSVIFVNKRKARVLALYCLTSHAIDLFRVSTPLVSTLRAGFQKYCRFYAVFTLDEAGNVALETFDGTVRAKRELVRSYRVPLSNDELGRLLELFGMPRASRRAA